MPSLCRELMSASYSRIHANLISCQPMKPSVAWSHLRTTLSSTYGQSLHSLTYLIVIWFCALWPATNAGASRCPGAAQLKNFEWRNSDAPKSGYHQSASRSADAIGAAAPSSAGLSVAARRSTEQRPGTANGHPPAKAACLAVGIECRSVRVFTCTQLHFLPEASSAQPARQVVLRLGFYKMAERS